MFQYMALDDKFLHVITNYRKAAAHFRDIKPDE